MSSDRKKICVKDRFRVRVQEDSGCDVPGHEVERLVLAQDLTQRLAVLEPFSLGIEGKKRGTPELNYSSICDHLLQIYKRKR